jgi:NADH-quinone oxidoreductase subunit B
VTDLGLPSVGRPAAPDPVRVEITDGTRTYALWALNVGLACCSVEFVAATAGAAPAHPPTEGAVDVLVVSGTCTHAMAPALRVLYDSLPEPRRVVSFGACANSGGPYWDSYAVTPGIDSVIPVDVYVPGCPPRPDAVLAALGELAERGSGER